MNLHKRRSWATQFFMNISRQKVIDFLDLTLLKDLVYLNIVLGISFALYSDNSFFTLQPMYLFTLGFSKVRIVTMKIKAKVKNWTMFSVGGYSSDCCNGRCGWHDIENVSGCVQFFRWIQSPPRLLGRSGRLHYFSIRFVRFFVSIGTFKCSKSSSFDFFKNIFHQKILFP